MKRAICVLFIVFFSSSIYAQTDSTAFATNQDIVWGTIKFGAKNIKKATKETILTFPFKFDYLVDDSVGTYALKIASTMETFYDYANVVLHLLALNDNFEKKFGKGDELQKLPVSVLDLNDEQLYIYKYWGNDIKNVVLGVETLHTKEGMPVYRAYSIIYNPELQNIHDAMVGNR